MNADEANIYLTSVIEKNRTLGENPTQVIVRLLNELLNNASELSSGYALYADSSYDEYVICKYCNNSFGNISELTRHENSCPVKKHWDLVEKLFIEGNFDGHTD